MASEKAGAIRRKYDVKIQGNAYELNRQRLSDVLKMVSGDIRDDALEVKQGKPKKFLRILLKLNGMESEFNQEISRCLARERKLSRPYLITSPSG